MNRQNQNIPLELAQVQMERGTSMNRDEFKALGYRDEELTEAAFAKAAEHQRRLENGRRAA